MDLIFRNLLYKKMLIMKLLTHSPNKYADNDSGKFPKEEINTLFIAAWSILSLEQLTWSNRGNGAGVCVFKGLMQLFPQVQFHPC